jgi:hypothetical protein
MPDIAGVMCAKPKVRELVERSVAINRLREEGRTQAAARRSAFGGSIRPLRDEDIDEVAGLWDRVFRQISAVTITDTRAFLRRTLLSTAWSDADLPSLVYANEEGKVLGFVGSNVRRLTFDGQLIRAVYTAHLMVDPTVDGPASGTRAIGGLLASRALKGPQDITLTDTANAQARAIWLALGGEPLQLGSFLWIRVFRPSRVLRFATERRVASKGWISRMPVWPLIDLVYRRAAASLQQETPSPGSDELLTPAAAAVYLPAITAGFRVRPVYDESSLVSLFTDLALIREDVVVRRLVRSRGRVVGTYVYLLRPGAVSRVLQVAAREDDAPTVLANLLEHAHANGAAAVTGRLEPQLRQSLRAVQAVLLPAPYSTLVYSSNRELLHAIHAGSALLTRLDGEWW